MKTIANQSLFDISIQQNGSVFCVVDWALQNNISITSDIEAGSNLIEPKSKNTNLEIKDYFSGKMIATNADSTNSLFQFGFGSSFQNARSAETYNAIAHQSLFDISVQNDGTLASIVDWSLKNNISITSSITAGQHLVNPNSNKSNKAVKNYFKNNGVRIATDIEEQLNYLDFLFPNIFPLSL